MAAFSAAWTRLGAEDDAGPLRVRLRDGEGRYRSVTCAARRDPVGGEVHGTLRDDAAEDAERARIEHEARLLKVIYQNISIIIWEIDTRGICTFHEGKGIEAFGLKSGQFVGTNLLALYADDPGLPELHRAIAGEMIRTYPEGVALESWYIPVRDDAGQVSTVVGVSLDLSAARRAEMELRDKLALVERQQQTIRSLGTPILEIWERVLTLPLLGAVDAVRAAEVMEGLLHRVRNQGSRFAILDLTGVEVMDTATAGHLLDVIRALRLLGAEGVITGIQPAMAQTMVTLGMNLTGITTRANLRDGLRFCIEQLRG